MRLCVRFLGLELLSIEASTDEDSAEDDKARDLSGGSTSSMPVGFTARWETVREDEGRDYD